MLRTYSQQRIRWLATIAVLCAAGCETSELNKVSQADCQDLRDHRADLRLSKVTTKGDSTLAQSELEKHRKTLQNAGGEGFLNKCVESRTPEWIECALKASTLDAIEKCP